MLRSACCINVAYGDALDGSAEAKAPMTGWMEGLGRQYGDGGDGVDEERFGADWGGGELRDKDMVSRSPYTSLNPISNFATRGGALTTVGITSAGAIV